VELSKRRRVTAVTTPMSFRTLRVWEGEQSRAFEELSYQLLRLQVPTGTHAIRTGNPDGGVEWYASLPDGTEWGWQAKHIIGIEALLSAMTDSVKRVAKDRPKLTKLVFVISVNLATGKNRANRKSQREKYEDKVAAWKATIPRANEISFELVQESDLLDKLTKPEHEGRRWFWWSDLTLGNTWLRQRLQEQADAASQKYRPDLQVDVPIQDDLLALGFDHLVQAQYERRRRDLLSSITDLRLPNKCDPSDLAVYQPVIDAAAALKTVLASLTIQAGTPIDDITPVMSHLSACQDAVVKAQYYERQLVSAWGDLPKDDPARKVEPRDWARHSIYEFNETLKDLRSWIASPIGKAFLKRAYFLSGQAGSGKTHLFLDATQRALDANRPAVFLAGARLGQGDLWASIAGQLGLGSVGADVLLGAMDAAGEAAAKTGSRFLIFVDALNETAPPDFWITYLPVLRAAVARYQHIALAVSCRDTYMDLVLEGQEGTHYVQRKHPGFAEREVEATHRYFAHYRLQAPKIPLLTPEFTLPLFLRLYCESLAGSPHLQLPTGHLSRIAIFEKYLNIKTQTVARRLRPQASSGYEISAGQSQVVQVINLLLDEMSRLGRESLSAMNAEKIARVPLNKSAADATKILGILQEEGILTREPLYLGDGNYEEGVRIVFQAFADFLLLKRRLALSIAPLEDQTIRTWLQKDSSWGIIEAATVFFPEAYGVELPDFLGVKVSRQPDITDRRKGWNRQHRTRQLYRSLVETLPYRDSSAITQRTVDLLNAAQPYLLRSEFYRVLFILGPQPGNRLNGEGLHRYLMGQHMPRRDSDFGFATYHEISDPSGPVARLARWAAEGPYPNYDPKVVELACIPLCWLFSSPNRFMRDWVTKALVQLLRGHLDVMRDLVERFWTVDDPYVVQRVVVVAYGALLRSTEAPTDQAKALAELVHRLVFSRPVRADELLLDAARGLIRWATAHGVLEASALESAQRPYGLTPPGPSPSEESIEVKYGWHKDQPDNESYSSLHFSLFVMGDFGRYVVGSGLRHFSRYRIGRAYPVEGHRRPRFVKRRWEMFVASLTDEQKAEIADYLNDPEHRTLNRLKYLVLDREDPLSDDQWKMLDACFVYPKCIDDGYPTDKARRWIFRRTIGLGWTPELFGQEDRNLGHSRGREGHKAERWGKKYQWMAYHEFLARVADNFQSRRRHDDEEAYEGLHQIIGEREIDPSLPPIAYRAFNEDEGANATSWGDAPIRLDTWPPSRLDFTRYHGSINVFLADTQTEMTADQSIFVRDMNGDDWVVLESSYRQVDPAAAKGWRGLQQLGAVHTLFAPSGESPALASSLGGQPQSVTRDLLDSHGHVDCCYVGEIGRAGPTCPHRADAFRPEIIGDSSWNIVSTIEEYRWEGNILDCSIGKSASIILPSSFIQRVTALSFDSSGPSWLDAAGRPVFVYYEKDGNDSHALLVRAPFLREFLAAQGMELLTIIWFERMQIGTRPGLEPEPRFIEWTLHARVDQHLKIHSGKPARSERLEQTFTGISECDVR
jgi:hypothetical protein